jgi:hypothetical protein
MVVITYSVLLSLFMRYHGNKHFYAPPPPAPALEVFSPEHYLYLNRVEICNNTRSDKVQGNFSQLLHSTYYNDINNGGGGEDGKEQLFKT